MLKVEYNVEIPHKHKDIDLVLDFLKDTSKKTMKLTYSDKEETRKRRAVLRNYIDRSEYGLFTFTHVINNELYVIKEK